MTLINKVRTATNALHQSLDNSLIPYIQSVRSKEDYAALLSLFYGFFKPIYDNIDNHIEIHYLPDYQNRRRLVYCKTYYGKTQR